MNQPQELETEDVRAVSLECRVRRFPWWQCQKCGEQIGLLGRFVEYILPFHPIKHKCKKIDKCDNWGVKDREKLGISPDDPYL